MIVIPAIDIIEGKCVRLTEGDYSKIKIYDKDPITVAKSFEDAGFTRLHLVDLDGARSHMVKNLKVLESIANDTRLHIDFGGGIKSDVTVESVFNAGANQLTLGSVAIREPGSVLGWLNRWGADRFILGLDLKAGKIAIQGWKETSQETWDSVTEFYQYSGIKTVISTNISKDGKMEGIDTDFYNQLINEFPDLNWIVSGGVTTLDDLEQSKLAGAYGAIIGKAFYEGLLTPQKVVKWMTKNAD